MYQVSLKSEGVRPFFVITWPGITHDLYSQLDGPYATNTLLKISVHENTERTMSCIVTKLSSFLPT